MQEKGAGPHPHLAPRPMDARGPGSPGSRSVKAGTANATILNKVDAVMCSRRVKPGTAIATSSKFLNHSPNPADARAADHPARDRRGCGIVEAPESNPYTTGTATSAEYVPSEAVMRTSPSSPARMTARDSP